MNEVKAPYADLWVDDLKSFFSRKVDVVPIEV
jgi:hypothetical protein